jgi:hypothetical protein
MRVREALLSTADNASMPDNDRGWGRIDVWAAIQHTVGVPAAGTSGVPALGARPNPFRSSTTFVAPRGMGEGRIEVHDVAGRLVWTAPIRDARLTWDGRNRDGRPVAPGVYVATLRIGDWRANAKLVRGD